MILRLSLNRVHVADVTLVGTRVDGQYRIRHHDHDLNGLIMTDVEGLSPSEYSFQVAKSVRRVRAAKYMYATRNILHYPLRNLVQLAMQTFKNKVTA